MMIDLSFTPEAIESSLAARFEAVALAMPDQVAIVDGEHSITYAALNRRANRLAHLMLALRGPTSEPVAFLIEHGMKQHVAMLAIAKVGKYYLPLDPNLPVEAMREMLSHAGAPVLIATDAYCEIAAALAAGQCEVLNLDQVPAGGNVGNPHVPIDPAARACLYYTSGSTGQPKGVLHSQRNVLYHMALIGREWSIGPADRIVHIIPCSFIGAMYLSWGALFHGATLAPFDLPREGFGRLRGWLQQQRITICAMVSTLFRHLANSLQDPTDLPDLRLITLGGEPFFASDVELFRARFSEKCHVHVIYGGTEALYVSQMVIGHAGEVTGPIVPIGYAVGDKEVLLRDEQGQIAAVAGAGEFVIRSRYMAPGYLDRPDLTAAVFIADPAGGERQLFVTGDFGLRSEDGLLVHLGRKDATVKIRGQRVELGAVEQAVRRCRGVKDAAVEVREDATGSKYLAAYVVLDESMPNPSVLRAQLRLQLPNVMVPSQFVVMGAMPLTISGKVDRRTLPDPAHVRTALPQPYVAARNDVEAVVLEAVEEVLAQGPIGVLDDFRDLGLDSVNLFRLWLRLEEGFKQELPLGTLPEPPTVENIAVLVQQSLAPLSNAP